MLLTLCHNYLCGLHALKCISTQRVPSDLRPLPLTLSVEISCDGTYKACVKTYKAIVDYCGLWSRPYPFGSQLQIGDSRLKDSSFPPTFWRAREVDDIIEHPLQHQLVNNLVDDVCSITKKRTGALDSAGLYRRLSKAKSDSSLPVGLGNKGGFRCPHNASTSWVSRKRDC